MTIDHYCYKDFWGYLFNEVVEAGEYNPVINIALEINDALVK